MVFQKFNSAALATLYCYVFIERWFCQTLCHSTAAEFERSMSVIIHVSFVEEISAE